MEQNENISSWRNACQYAACVDLVTQIIGFIGMIFLCVLLLPSFTDSEMEWNAKALFAVLIFLCILIQFLFFALAIMMIKQTSIGRVPKDVLKITSRWKGGQYFLLFLSVTTLAHGYWVGFVVQACIRLPLIYIATKFINELKTDKGFERLEKQTREDPENMEGSGQ